MKRIKVVILFITLQCLFIKLAAQINMRLHLSGGLLNVEAPYKNYELGYQVGTGLLVSAELKWLNNLSWETGIKCSFGETVFYPLKRGSFLITNGNYPLNTDEEILHRFYTLNLPVKLKYNAFGFMGILGGMELSYLIDGNIHIPRLSKTNRIFNYNKITPLIEGGLFFPIGKKVIIEATAYRAIRDRFYTSYTKDINGDIINLNGHSDYGISLNISYQLN